MFAKTRLLLQELRTYILRTNELAGFGRKDIAIVRQDVEDIIRKQHEWFTRVERNQAAMAKTLSSIEMEMLLQRGACLDNNFEGKEQL